MTEPIERPALRKQPPASPRASSADAPPQSTGVHTLPRDRQHVLRVPRLWRDLLVFVLLPLLAAATWFASRQPPHPDMYRPIGLWDLGRADWWAYPLERMRSSAPWCGASSPQCSRFPTEV